MENNNQYWDSFSRSYGDINEENIVFRISECNMVLDELAKTNVWKIVINDAKKTVKWIDDNWQTLDPNTPSYNKARIVKLASKQLVDMPGDYLSELETLQERLRLLQNPQEIIEKDNDNG